MNKKLISVLLVLVLASLACGFYPDGNGNMVFHMFTPPATATQAESSNNAEIDAYMEDVNRRTADATAQAYTDPNTIPFAQAKTCPDMAKDEIRAVDTGLTIAGDVAGEIAKDVWKEFFQSDIGEYTFIINMSDGPINVKAPFGAGCLLSTDLQTLVKGEIANPNHTDLKSVRVVVYTSAYTFTEHWYGPDGKLIK